ncbi:MAG: SDR family oxidoreductase [Proteobacteria bacterium]|nr:SDR family oxidoreductase [Pseudomonadota bacterium]HQR02695.1 SDR family oxidoreductase [Rhodocyclaceae bacterium]
MKKEFPLAGMSALITGGAGGIGSGSAQLFLEDGCSVTLMGRRIDALERARDRLQPLAQNGAKITLVVGDAMKAEDMKRAVAAATESTGRMEICVATVGGGGFRPLLLQDEKSALEEIAFNFQPTFLAIRHSIPVMAAQGGGSIVCISSEAAHQPQTWLSVYTAGKAAVEGLVKSCANELARHNIRVNAVRPGLTRAECTQGMFSSEAIVKASSAARPLGRLGEPEDIAAGVRYLAGPESSWVTGQSFAIEGGGELRGPVDISEMAEAVFGKEVMAKILAGKEV